VVLTTSPIQSAHLVGLGLRRTRKVHWIADLRDGWRYEAPRADWPLAAQRCFDDLLERRVLSAADAVVTVSEPLTRDLSSRLGIPVETITNGFDPDDLAPPPPITAGPSGRFTITHTGGLGKERTVEPIVEALLQLRSGDPSVEDRVQLVIAGAQTQQEQRLYAEHRDTEMIRPVGMLPRSEALALQRSADLLLLVTSGMRTGEATGKLFEYLATGRPILVLGDDSEAARMVEGAGAGWSIPVRDKEAAIAILHRIIAGEQPPPGTGKPRESYAYPVLAERYAELIERVISERSSSQRS
jgi:glycosyltransferase involved in cell wall biosynthesis